jgi:PPM family protein phosphatase
VSLRLEYKSALDVGRARQNNEDAVLIDEKLSLCLLADGMGGYNAGEVASELAIHTLREHFRQWVRQQTFNPTDDAVDQALIDAAQHANDVVFRSASEIPAYAGMGTTLVTALFDHHHIWLGHLGDSRAYRWRNGRLVQLTRDHSLLQEQIDAGLLTPEEAAYATHRNLVTRAVGVEPEVTLEVHRHDIEEGDLYLLCSDGLSDMLPDRQVAEILQLTKPLEALTSDLIQAANAAGGRDNISVILVRAVKCQDMTTGRMWWPFRG